MRILLAVDGSKYALDAVDSLIQHADWYREKPAVELVTVHLPVPKLPRMGLVVGKNQIRRYYEEEGEALLRAAKKKLDAQILVGQPGETIVAHAKRMRCDLILVGSQGRSAARNLLVGSVATRVLQLATVPVMLVK
jgi:nucleotide-binding universal stress UspA family protein